MNLLAIRLSFHLAGLLSVGGVPLHSRPLPAIWHNCSWTAAATRRACGISKHFSHLDTLLADFTLNIQGKGKVKIIGKSIILLFLFVVMLTSCSGFTAPPATSPTDAIETAILITGTAVVKTQAAIPTDTPLFIIPFYTPTPIPGAYAIIPPNPDQQVYLDPDGWYSVNFPTDMQATDKPNSFSRQGNFFETGYLPELGYMSTALSVCGWLANVEFESQQSIIDRSNEFSSLPRSYPRCSVSTNDTLGSTSNYAIYENPGANPEHRFIYIKTGKNYPSANSVETAFSWLKPIDETRFEPEFAPISSEETSLWENTAAMLRDVSITEYVLPPEGQVGPSEEMLLRFVPEAMLPNWVVDKPNIPYKETPIEDQLKPLGYELKADETKTGWKQLFRDGRLMFDYVVAVSNVYTFSTDSGTITAFTVDTRGTGGEYYNRFLIQNDTVNKWEYNHQDPRFEPILYQGELLWLKATKDFGHVQIMKSDQQVVYSFALYTEPIYSVSRFRTWNGHWSLAARDFVIQDGEILNEKFGFQEIFSWNLVDDKPVYLFRKGPRIGFSYDGKILPLEYQDVGHHFCCGFSSNNPYVGEDTAHFFGKRNGVWYYVVVKFK